MYIPENEDNNPQQVRRIWIYIYVCMFIYVYKDLDAS